MWRIVFLRAKSNQSIALSNHSQHAVKWLRMECVNKVHINTPRLSLTFQCFYLVNCDKRHWELWQFVSFENEMSQVNHVAYAHFTNQNGIVFDAQLLVKFFSFHSSRNRLDSIDSDENHSNPPFEKRNCNFHFLLLWMCVFLLISFRFAPNANDSMEFVFKWDKKTNNCKQIVQNWSFAR